MGYIEKDSNHSETAMQADWGLKLAGLEGRRSLGEIGLSGFARSGLALVAEAMDETEDGTPNQDAFEQVWGSGAHRDLYWEVRKPHRVGRGYRGSVNRLVDRVDEVFGEEIGLVHHQFLSRNPSFESRVAAMERQMKKEGRPDWIKGGMSLLVVMGQGYGKVLSKPAHLLRNKDRIQRNRTAEQFWKHKLIGVEGGNVGTAFALEYVSYLGEKLDEMLQEKFGDEAEQAGAMLAAMAYARGEDVNGMNLEDVRAAVYDALEAGNIEEGILQLDEWVNSGILKGVHPEILKRMGIEPVVVAEEDSEAKREERKARLVQEARERQEKYSEVKAREAREYEGRSFRVRKTEVVGGELRELVWLFEVEGTMMMDRRVPKVTNRGIVVSESRKVEMVKIESRLESEEDKMTRVALRMSPGRFLAIMEGEEDGQYSLVEEIVE